MIDNARLGWVSCRRRFRRRLLDVSDRMPDGVPRWIGNPECRCDGPKACAVCPHVPGQVKAVRGHDCWPSAGASLTSCGFETGSRAFTNQVAFELGHCAEHVKDQLPTRRGRIEPFRQRPEVDPTVLERLHDLDEMAKRATQPAKPPHAKHVTRPQVIQTLLRPRTLLGGT